MDGVDRNSSPLPITFPVRVVLRGPRPPWMLGRVFRCMDGWANAQPPCILSTVILSTHSSCYCHHNHRYQHIRLCQINPTYWLSMQPNPNYCFSQHLWCWEKWLVPPRQHRHCCFSCLSWPHLLNQSIPSSSSTTYSRLPQSAHSVLLRLTQTALPTQQCFPFPRPTIWKKNAIWKGNAKI